MCGVSTFRWFRLTTPESFNDLPNGRTPRITSIAIRNLETAQTESFSIQQIAEQQKIDFQNIPQHYDEFEKVMLDDLYCYIKEKKSATWVHWNMRDTNYGFTAIEHRYKVLGGVPYSITDDHKFDLSRALIDLYGINYIGHPRLENVVRINKMSDLAFMNGASESGAFKEGNYIAMHNSTLRKVDIFENIFTWVSNNTLKVETNWFEQRGLTIETILEYIKSHWIITFLGLLITISSLIYKCKVFFGH